MASLVNIDYNPLRRAISLDYSSKAAEDTAKRIDLTRQTLSNQVWQNEINERKLDIQQRKLNEAKQREEDNKFWKGVLGAVKIAGGLALGIFGGPMGIVAGVGLGLSGMTDAAYALPMGMSDEMYSGLQGIINTGTQVAGQIYSYQSQLAEQGADTDIAKAMAAGAANGLMMWSADSGTLGLNTTNSEVNTFLESSIKTVDEKYGAGMGEKALKKWEAQHLGAGASQLANQAQNMGRQVVDNALSAFIAGDSSAEDLTTTINSLPLPPDTKGQVLHDTLYKGYVSAAQEYETARALEGEYTPATINARARMATVANQLSKNLPTIADYQKQGYNYQNAINLVTASRQPLIMNDGEVTGIRISEGDKKAIEAKRADALREQTIRLMDESKTVFEAALKNNQTIAQATETALDTIITGDEQVREKVTGYVYGLQKEQLENRFDVQFLEKENPYAIETMMRNYKPRGAYAGDYAGFEKLQMTHYDRIKTQHARLTDEVNKVIAPELKKENEEQIKARKQAVAIAYNDWRIGMRDGLSALDVLITNRDVISDDTFYKQAGDIIKGKDTATETDAAFKQIESLFKDKKLNIPSDRQKDIMKSLYSVRMGITDKNFKPLTEAVENFIKVETAGALSKAMSSYAQKQNISGKQFNQILDLANLGGLDDYLFKYTDWAGDGEGEIGFDTKAAAVGGNNMRGMMEVVKKQSQQEIAKLTGKAADGIKLEMMKDETGDEDGFFVWNNNGETIRLARTTGIASIINPYYLEKLENGKWVKYEYYQ